MRSLGFFAALTLLVPAAGCVSLSTCCHWGEDPGPPPIQQVLVFWDNHLHVTQNSVRSGTALPGMVGRVWLFADDPKHGAEANGSMVIEMYDMTPVQSGGQAQQLVRVTYDLQTLKRLKQKDYFGDGYTLFIPWETYNPAVKEVKLQLAYVPEKGTPYYSEETWVTLRTPQQPPAIEGQEKQVVPALHKK
jgi:hypothetical protein